MDETEEKIGGGHKPGDGLGREGNLQIVEKSFSSIMSSKPKVNKQKC